MWSEPPDIVWTRYRGQHTAEITQGYRGVYRAVAASQLQEVAVRLG